MLEKVGRQTHPLRHPGIVPGTPAFRLLQFLSVLRSVTRFAAAVLPAGFVIDRIHKAALPAAMHPL